MKRFINVPLAVAVLGIPCQNLFTETIFINSSSTKSRNLKILTDYDGTSILKTLGSLYTKISAHIYCMYSCFTM